MATFWKNGSQTIAGVLALIILLEQPAGAVRLPLLLAEPQALAQSAPPPGQIAAAKTVFVTNMGTYANFPLDATRGYNDFYGALKAWGRYRLVESASEADLVFQLKGVAPITGVNGSDTGVYSVTSPAFEVTILDAKTGVPLWTVHSPLKLAVRKTARERWIATSERNLVSRIKVLAGETLTPAESAALLEEPKTHARRTGLILGGAAVGAGVIGALLIHRAYENSLANQKAQQDQFCAANGIPLSQCAGG